MTLDDLKARAAKKIASGEDEVGATCMAGEDEEEETSLEEGFSDAFDLLQSCLDEMEKLRVRNGRLVNIPDLADLMEEVADFIEEWSADDDDGADAPVKGSSVKGEASTIDAGVKNIYCEDLGDD